jgi:hypothetical protein
MPNASLNKPPLVNAGVNNDYCVKCNRGALSGTATDVDGSIIFYEWSQLSGPTQTTVASANEASTLFANISIGKYQFVLKATDNSGATATDTTEITVVPDINEITFDNLTWGYVQNDITADEPRLAPASRIDLFCEPSKVKEVAVRSESSTEWVTAKQVYEGAAFNYDIYRQADLRVLGGSGFLVGTKASVRVKFF